MTKPNLLILDQADHIKQHYRKGVSTGEMAFDVWSKYRNHLESATLIRDSDDTDAETLFNTRLQESSSAFRYPSLSREAEMLMVQREHRNTRASHPLYQLFISTYTPGKTKTNESAQAYCMKNRIPALFIRNADSIEDEMDRFIRG